MSLLTIGVGAIHKRVDRISRIFGPLPSLDNITTKAYTEILTNPLPLARQRSL